MIKLPSYQVMGLLVIALVCAAYLGAFCLARAVRLRPARLRGGGRVRCGRRARLVGSAGVALAVMSPALAAGAPGGGGKSVGSLRQATTPPWDLPEPGQKISDSGTPAQNRHGPRAPDSNHSQNIKGSAESSAPPWSGDDGSSPPRLLRRTGAEADAREPSQVEKAERFGRGSRTEAPEARASRAAESTPRGDRGKWKVRAGDTLWDIAAQVLHTSDGARIARYWPAIHRANREVIGADPSLIYPGTILRLPEEEPGK